MDRDGLAKKSINVRKLLSRGIELPNGREKREASGLGGLATAPIVRHRNKAYLAANR